MPLFHGGEIGLFGEQISKQPMAMASAIADRSISVWYSTPSVLRLLVEFGQLESYDWSALHLVLFAGEVFPVKHLRALLAAWPAPWFFNLSGPTETNVCTYHEIPSRIPDEREDPFPIGRVCENDEGLVVDERNGRCPRRGGRAPDRGGTVMQGYWNMPDRTEQAFHVDADGGRWYRTGDLVREEADATCSSPAAGTEWSSAEAIVSSWGRSRRAVSAPRGGRGAVIALPSEDGVRIDAFVCGPTAQRDRSSR